MSRRALTFETNFGKWKPFKSDKKCFLFHLKSSFYFPKHLGHSTLVKKQLQYTDCAISEAIKESQTMKFGQLLEHNMINIFIGKSNTKCGQKTIYKPDPFLKNQNWAYLWINSLKFHATYLYCVLRWGLLKCIETKLQTAYFKGAL